MLLLDFETRSLVPLGGKDTVGLDNYAKHPSTKALMLAWAYNDEPVRLWFPEDPMPDKLRKGIEGNEKIAAWNSTFERYIFYHVLTIAIPVCRWSDPQASARYLSLPADLGTCGDVLELPSSLRKDARGEALIELFSEPKLPRKKKGQEPGEPYFNTADTHPDEWDEFCEYCKRDVISEREIMRRLGLLGVYPLPEREQQIWYLDQKINDRGVPVDVEFAKKMYSIALRSKAEAVAEQRRITGIDKPNGPKLLPWVRERGFPGNSLRKEAVIAALKNPEVKLTDECRKVLTNRRIAASTSYTKLAAILRCISSDSRLRNQFVYMGSSRCGRWSGNAVQLHNFARPEKEFEDKATVDEARTMVNRNDYDGLVKRFGQPLRVVKNLLRTVFVATP